MVMWSVVILLLLIGIFLQVRSARGDTPTEMARRNLSVAVFAHWI
jgi:uncharacterized membrane protein